MQQSCNPGNNPRKVVPGWFRGVFMGFAHKYPPILRVAPMAEPYTHFKGGAYKTGYKYRLFYYSFKGGYWRGNKGYT